MGWIVSTIVLLKDGVGSKQPTKVDIPLKQRNQTKKNVLIEQKLLNKMMKLN